MDRQLDGAAPPSGGPRAEPETAAVYGHGIGRGSGADRRTSPEWGRWICLPGPAAWPASVCRRLRRRAGRSPAHHPGERIARLRREFPGLERTLTLARVVVGAARVGGDRAAELQRVLCARPVVGFAGAEPGYDRPQEAGSRTVERTLAAPGPVFVASVSRLTTPARTGALPNRRPPRVAMRIVAAAPSNGSSGSPCGTRLNSRLSTGRESSTPACTLNTSQIGRAHV